MGALREATRRLPVVLPLHPRGGATLAAAGLVEVPGLSVVDPLGYLEFLSLVRGAAVVITDSGGIQEETTVLDVPCLTLRPNTERPITLTAGTNRLVAPESLGAALDGALRGALARPGDGPPRLGRPRRRAHRRASSSSGLAPDASAEAAAGDRADARHACCPDYAWNPYQRLLAAALTRARHRGCRRSASGQPGSHPGGLAGAGPAGRGASPLDPRLPRRQQGPALPPQRALVRLAAPAAQAAGRAHRLDGAQPQGTRGAGADPDERRRRPSRPHRARRRGHPALRVGSRGAHRALPARAPAARSGSTSCRTAATSRSTRSTRSRRGPRSAWACRSGGPVFAFVGAIRGYKGVGELLEAFAGSTDLGPDARLLICGKPLPARLGRELEQRAVADPRIVLRLERMPEEELSQVLRAADVVVLPFRDILTSGSAILALSLGRPVIAPALGCLPETLPATPASCTTRTRPMRSLTRCSRRPATWPRWEPGQALRGQSRLGADRGRDGAPLPGG